MNFAGPLDFLPLWVLFVATIVIVLLSQEGGYRLGTYRRQRTEPEKEAPVGAMVGAMLGLLAFMLAFTFGMAASRFDARRIVLLDEANAIGTAYLRAGLLPKPHRSKIRHLLRDYVDVRLEAVQSGNVVLGIAKSSQLHGPLWAQAAAAAEKDPRSIVTGLFIQSLNEVINLHEKRVAFGLRSRVPGPIWVALYSQVILAFAAMGYLAGMSGSRRSLAVLLLALAFSGVMLLIADLDRPHEGVVKLSQQAMIDLKNSLMTPDEGADGTRP
jgi:hypothetical protein